MPLRVALVHPQQVAGPQRRLVTAGGGPQLDDHVLVVVGVLGDEHHLEFGLECGEPFGLLGGDALQVDAHLRIVLAGEQVLGVAQLLVVSAVGPVGIDHLFQLAVTDRDLPEPVRVTQDVGIDQLLEHGFVLGLERPETLDEGLIHPLTPAVRTRR